MKHNQYIIYIDDVWVRHALYERFGRMASPKERSDFMDAVRNHVMDFINGRDTDETKALFTVTFVGNDGHLHRAIEIKCIPGSDSSTKPLKRVKKLRRLKKIAKH